MPRPSRAVTIAAVAAAAVLVGASLALTFSVPVERLLGTRVYLPIFHGASTWVDIVVLTMMGVAAAAHLLTRKPDIYAWEVGFRSVGAPLWAINTGLGLVAALRTWDFSGSQQSPFAVAMRDPRLAAQFWLLLAVGVLLGLMLFLEQRWQKSAADLGFVVLMAVLLGNVLIDPAKRALHPDNPVLNSGWDVKGPFFGIVACLFVAALIVTWLVRSHVRAGLAEESAENVKDLCPSETISG